MSDNNILNNVEFNSDMDETELLPITEVKKKKVSENQRNAGLKNLEIAREKRKENVSIKKKSDENINMLNAYSKFEKLINIEPEKKQEIKEHKDDIYNIITVMNQNMNKMNERILKIHERYKLKDAQKIEKMNKKNENSNKNINNIYSSLASKLLNIK